MNKNKHFMLGMLALLLTFGLVLVGCPTDSGDDGGGTPFDGSALAGTKWTATQSAMPVFAGLTVDTKATLQFTSDTAGTAAFEVTKWNGQGWSEEMKSKIKEGISEDNGAFTSTYDAAAKTGTYTLKSGTPGTFTVDAGKKELTTTQVDDGETETTIFKLQ
jgi:hypothetical protein